MRQTLTYLANKIVEYVPKSQQIKQEIEQTRNLSRLGKKSIIEEEPYYNTSEHREQEYMYVRYPEPGFIKALLPSQPYDYPVVFGIRL